MLRRSAGMCCMRPTFDPALPVSRYVSAGACFTGAAVSWAACTRTCRLCLRRAVIRHVLKGARTLIRCSRHARWPCVRLLHLCCATRATCGSNVDQRSSSAYSFYSLSMSWGLGRSHLDRAISLVPLERGAMRSLANMQTYRPAYPHCERPQRPQVLRYMPPHALRTQDRNS